MNRSRVILLTAFLLVLCAGVVVGRLWRDLPPVETSARAAGTQPSWFAEQLELRPDQRKAIDAIWAETKPKIDKSMEGRQALDRERDQAIQELLTPAEWTAYDKIIEDFRAKRTDLDKQRHQLLDEANEKSVALLDDQQKKKWEAFRNSHDHDRRSLRSVAGSQASVSESPTTREMNP